MLLPMSSARWKWLSYWSLVAAGAVLVVLTMWHLRGVPLSGPRQVQWPELSSVPQTRGFWYTQDGFWTIIDNQRLAFVNLATGVGRKAAELDVADGARPLHLRPAGDGLFVVFREKKPDTLSAGIVHPVKPGVPLQTLRVPGQGRTYLLGVGGNPERPEMICWRGDKLCWLSLSAGGQKVKELLWPPDTRPIGAYQETNGSWVVLVLMDEQQIFLARDMRIDTPGATLPPKSAGVFDLSDFGVASEQAATLKLFEGGEVGKVPTSSTSGSGPLHYVDGVWKPLDPTAARNVLQNTPRTVLVGSRPVALTQWGSPLTALWPGSAGRFWLCSDSGEYYVQLDRQMRRADPLTWPEHLLATRARDRHFDLHAKRYDNLFALAWILLGFPLALLSGWLFPRYRGVDLAIYLVTAGAMYHFLSPLFG
jgi:hypothetical protein